MKVSEVFIMETTLISKEEWLKSRKDVFQSAPDWWKQTRTYEVQKQEGYDWVTVLTSDTEWIDDFRLVATNPYMRILKNGKDVTAKYSSNCSRQPSTNFGIVMPVYGPEPNKRTTGKSMTPHEYKALPRSEKETLWKSIDILLENKAKRAEIFAELNISESTYDTIRLERKTLSEVAASDKPVHEETRENEVKVNTDSATIQPKSVKSQVDDLLSSWS